MLQSTRELLARATATAERLRAGGKHDRANRFCGRAEVAIARHCARHCALLPTLYVNQVPGEHPAHPRFTLTTWPGNFVACLEVTGQARGFNGARLTCYAATIEGRRYYGRGLGPGMYLNLRPGKLVRGGK